MRKPIIHHKIFTEKNYISLRTKIYKWLEENREIKVVDITEVKNQPEKPGPIHRAIGISYERP